MQDNQRQHSGIDTAKRIVSAARIAKAAAAGGVHGAAVAAAKEAAPFLAKLAIWVLAALIALPMLIFAYLPNIFFGFSSSGTASVARMTGQAMTLGGFYMDLEDFENTQIDAIVTSLIQQYEEEGTGKNFSPEENYTAFWVRDDYVAKHTDLKESLAFEKPTAEEKIFWESANQIDKTINCKDIKEKFSYLVFVTSFWRNPLNCKKCFPSDPLGEFPLVETDPTSTIPTLQLYLNETDRSVSTIGISENIEHDDTENDRRIAELKNHLLYGHISRGRNHYQYYVRTKQFFQHEREKIKAWLSELRYLAKNEDPDAFKKSINVLVIPKQSSNVEFGQFVYEYFFHGEAESIIVNTEKEFRSNFRAEYHALFLRLKTQMQNKYQIRFHYVDTAISSGTTFSRASTLITTCFNEINGTPANAVFKTHPFANVFLLISRLSKYSKYDYVLNPQTDFHAYAELHISSIRTFGDSCVPCKLQQESVKYYRYWGTGVHSFKAEEFEIVELLSRDYEVQELCSLMGVSRSGYYPLQTRTLQGFESSCPLLKKDFGKNYCPCPLLKKQLP